MAVLTEVAREGAGKCIETQKKLLDLAIEQLEAAAKAGGDHKVPRKETLPPWGELTEKSVKNFVSAEKSLLDLAMKPVKAGREESRRASRHRASKKEAAGTKEGVAAVA
jgi:hypothetical protein